MARLALLRSHTPACPAAFALNRLLSPLRILVCLVLVPFVAAPINRLADPWVARVKAWWSGAAPTPAPAKRD